MCLLSLSIITPIGTLVSCYVFIIAVNYHSNWNARQLQCVYSKLKLYSSIEHIAVKSMVYLTLP